MNVDVKLFAVAKQLVSAASVRVEVPRGSTVAHLRASLCRQYPALTPVMDQMRFAVDTEYASEETVIGEDAEVACIPPVSGG